MIHGLNLAQKNTKPELFLYLQTSIIQSTTTTSHQQQIQRNEMNALLSNKVTVITGGNSGIGFATAQKFKEEGATVVITGRSEEKVKQAAAELGVEGIVADVQDLASIDRLVEQVKNTYGAIDTLFVNAGVFVPSPIGHLEEESYDYQMNINLKGAIFTLEKFLPVLKDGASVINLSSINAYTGMPNTALYAASKAGLNAFSRTAATELAPRKIRVNVVNPGPIATPIFGKAGLSEEQLQGMGDAMQARIPLKRYGEPSEIANMVCFLASDQSSFMTGSEINVDGGTNINPLLG